MILQTGTYHNSYLEQMSSKCWPSTSISWIFLCRASILDKIRKGQDRMVLGWESKYYVRIPHWEYCWSSRLQLSLFVAIVHHYHLHLFQCRCCEHVVGLEDGNFNSVFVLEVGVQPCLSMIIMMIMMIRMRLIMIMMIKMDFHLVCVVWGGKGNPQ